MDEVVKKMLLTQLELAQHQLKAIQTIILHITAPVYEKPIISPRDDRVLSDHIDDEIGSIFESLKPQIDEGNE